MLALATLLLLTAPTAEAKGKPGRKSKKTEAAAEKADTTKKEKKGYEELLKGAVTDKGMFDVHRKGTDFLFEIPDSLMGRDILIVNKISGVPYALNDAGVNKGMGYGEKIVRFRKDTLYKKVWVMTYDPRITSPEGDRITRSVRDNYRETAIEQFPIDAYGKDSASVVIKVNKVFDGSEKSFNNVFGSIGLPGSPKKDLSKIESVKSFPENIIVKSLLSTSHTEEGTTIPLTVEITSNLVLLAREPMRPRFSDDRVGYFEIGHLYFNDEQQKAEERAFINRWRLEPKPEDVERYKKGELVEPQKPIELWIDPATPPVWVPYIKKGIVEWQEAFEAAGFKTRGCLAMTGCASATCSMIEGRTFDEALALTIEDVREAVGGVPAGKANTLTFSVEAVRALIGDFLAREGAGLAELDAVVPCDSYSVACLMCEHCSLRDTRTDLLVAAMDGE